MPLQLQSEGGRDNNHRTEKNFGFNMTTINIQHPRTHVTVKLSCSIEESYRMIEFQNRQSILACLGASCFFLYNFNFKRIIFTPVSCMLIRGRIMFKKKKNHVYYSVSSQIFTLIVLLYTQENKKSFH